MLRRCTRSIDGTIPIPALLYNDEELLASQGSVGIYDGPQKSNSHQSGTIHVSTHRLFYVDAQNELSRSFAMDLSLITQTEYYTGLFKSSPKVTLHLSVGNSFTPGTSPTTVLEHQFESWECEVCSYRNPPGLSPAAARICALCGVPRSSVPKRVKAVLEQHLSSSLPSSSFASTLSSSVSLAAESEPRKQNRSDDIACPACTFLNHPSLPTCEICSSPLPRAPHHAGLGMKSAPSTRPTSPDLAADDLDDDNLVHRMIKLSFRKGGDRAFYAVLKRSLMAKAWEANGIGKRNRTGTTGPDTETVRDQKTIGRSGINGILLTVETSARSTETDMKDALQDLEALMVKAKDMVRLAAELNERLTASSTTLAPSNAGPQQSLYSTKTLVPSTEPEEATFIRSSLSQLGLQMTNTPVTQDMIRDERRWIEELSRELARVLQGGEAVGPGRTDGKENLGLMRDRGILALDEVWGGWNRARGVALIPPSTFLLVLPHLAPHTDPPISTRAFPSGLTVLHIPPYSHAAFAARLAGLLALVGPKTTIEVAHEERLTVSLAAEMITAVEEDGHICRDDGTAVIKGGGSGGSGELRWWVNIFRGYVWDGHDVEE